MITKNKYKKISFNADFRKSSATKIGGSANNFGGNTDKRRFFLETICDNPREIRDHLRSNKIFQKSTKIGILSLGCPRNLVDSESILGRLALKGYPVVDIERCDVAIVNTCSFIEDAKVESIDALLDLIDLKRKGKLKKLIVYGCLTQRYKDQLRKELPEVDAFVGNISLNHNLWAFSLTPKHYAYLKICEGCINNCSYCIIPKIKPRFNSLNINSILDKVERFDKDRIFELNIIGQDITGYGIDLYGTLKLPELLKRIVKRTRNIGWIRLLYMYPSRISDELLELMSNEPKICKYVDLPLQHINDRILRLMYRNTTKKDILKLIDKIRTRIPDVAIRTSIIVGFPSETDKEFKELLKFIEDIRFERLGAFIYSQEEDTKAFNFKQQISHKIKIERFNTLMSCQQRISQDINREFLGKIIDVLIDENEKDYYLGRSQYDAPEVDGIVYVHPRTNCNIAEAKHTIGAGVNSKRALKPGDFVKVKVTDTLEYDLVGEVLEKDILNADLRKSSATKIGGSANNFGGNADIYK